MSVCVCVCLYVCTLIDLTCVCCYRYLFEFLFTYFGHEIFNPLYITPTTITGFGSLNNLKKNDFDYKYGYKTGISGINKIPDESPKEISSVFYSKVVYLLDCQISIIS